MYALIIAGGEGERLRPLTDDRPKAMVAVRGRPLIEHQLHWLRQGGVTHAILLARYKADVLQAHLQDGACSGVKIVFSLEDEPLGRGGALRKGFTLVPAEEQTVLAVNGDILTEQPVFALLPEKGDHEDTTFPSLSADGRLLGFKSTASWRAIDTFKDLREAERELAIGPALR